LLAIKRKKPWISSPAAKSANAPSSKPSSTDCSAPSACWRAGACYSGLR
jgi:hypothetical protein